MLASIRVRIIAAFMAGMLVMLAAIGVLVVQYRGVSQSQELITNGYLPLAKTVARLTTWQARIDNDVRRLLGDEARPGTGARSAAAIYADELKEQLDTARIHTRASQRIAKRPEEQAVLNKVLIQLGRIDNLFVEYRDEAARIVALAEKGNRDQAQEKGTKLLSLSTELGDEIETLSRQIDGRIAQLTAETEAQRVRATAIAGVLSLVAFVSAFALLGLVFYALRPIGRLTDQVQRLAAGDYSGRVEVRGADEIAGLAMEFDKMVQALKLRDEALVDRAEQLNTLSRYLASVLDSLQEGLFVLEGGRVTLANPAAGDVWGAARDQGVPDGLRAYLEPGRYEVDGPGGTLHEVRVTPFGTQGAVVVTADITEETRAKERLARSERLALVGQMLAQITHEVRNPLNALSLNTEMLADELSHYDPERQTEGWDILGTISSEIDRLTDVTAHYLQLARRPPAKIETHDLSDLVRDVERLLAAELESQSVALALDLADLPPLLADGNQLRQALLNVVRNAVEAGAHHLSLATREVDGNVEIELSDDGPGMGPEDVERATDPFYSTKASGTGLGLAITRQILEDHDGSIRVRSAPGRGTDIALIFPFRPASREPGDALEAPLP
ncbi:MAG: HAMP domain-containing protein [Alphaproteobacteria bacterium]|nr:HAMP domain-containing protein [Alphaproteobacteria bacterium]